jgi:hypothetical protein
LKREATTRPWWHIKGNDMSEKKTASVSIDGNTYTEEQLTDQQKVMVNHVADLDRKIASARFNVDQLQVGRDAFFAMLKASLSTTDEAAKPVTDAA